MSDTSDTNTGGGSYVGRDARAGGDYVGRDKHNVGDGAHHESNVNIHSERLSERLLDDFSDRELLRRLARQQDQLIIALNGDQYNRRGNPGLIALSEQLIEHQGVADSERAANRSALGVQSARLDELSTRLWHSNIVLGVQAVAIIVILIDSFVL